MVLGYVPRGLIRISAGRGLCKLSTRSFLSTNTRTSTKTAHSLALSLYKPTGSALVRFASNTTKPPGIESIDTKHEAEISQRVMRAHPERVSSESTTHPLFHEVVDAPDLPEPDMMAGIKGDLVRADGRLMITTDSLRKLSKKRSLFKRYQKTLFTLVWLASYLTLQHPYLQSIWLGI